MKNHAIVSASSRWPWAKRRCESVSACAVAPGVIETEMSQAVRDLAGDQINSRILLKRIGKPEEIANVAGFVGGEVVEDDVDATSTRVIDDETPHDLCCLPVDVDARHSRAPVAGDADLVERRVDHTSRAVLLLQAVSGKEDAAFHADILAEHAASGAPAFKPKFSDFDVVVSNYNGEPWSAETKMRPNGCASATTARMR